MLNSLMNGSSLSNGLAQGIAATLAASNGGHQQPQQTSVGNGLKEFLLEQHQLVRHLVLVNVVVAVLMKHLEESHKQVIKANLSAVSTNMRFKYPILTKY